MRKVDIKKLNEKVNKPYKWEEKVIEDYAGCEFKFMLIKLANKDGRYWAMNTNNDVDRTWVIKKDTEYVKVEIGLEETMKELQRLNDELEMQEQWNYIRCQAYNL